jgi:hypothetical protein
VTHSRVRTALVIATTCAALATCSSTSSKSADADTASTHAAGKLLGPQLSRVETPTLSYGRDGGISVPLPNGKDFWIFGDTPRYDYIGGKWKLTNFIYGSSAAMVSFTPGKRPTARLQEIAAGKKHSPNRHPEQFLSTARVYLPNGSGKICNKANGGAQAGAERWAIGAAMMPDKKNVFISFIDVCVTGAVNYTTQGWGFALYNWKANKFTQKPYDVWKPHPSGRAISPQKYFGSPVIAGGKITFFSRTWGKSNSRVFRTTVSANVNALKKASSYKPVAISGIPTALVFSVAGPSRTHPRLTMYQSGGSPQGSYRLYTASKPAGPWKLKRTGTLPKCTNSHSLCNSVFMHPELSSAKQMIMTYFVPGYGPGIATKHPYPGHDLGHNVWASIPY